MGRQIILNETGQREYSPKHGQFCFLAIIGFFKFFQLAIVFCIRHKIFSEVFYLRCNISRSCQLPKYQGIF